MTQGKVTLQIQVTQAVRAELEALAAAAKKRGELKPGEGAEELVARCAETLAHGWRRRQGLGGAEEALRLGPCAPESD